MTILKIAPLFFLGYLGATSGQQGNSCTPKTVFDSQSNCTTFSSDINIFAAGKGVVVKSPNGLICARLAINNAGAVTSIVIPCPA